MSAPETMGDWYVCWCGLTHARAITHEPLVTPPQPPAPPPDARLAEIRARLPDVQRQYVGNPAWLAIHARYVADVTDLLARVESDAATIAALRGDAERLDWLTKMAADTAKLIGVAGTCYGSVYVGRKRIASGDDVREAIDAAMRAGAGRT